MLTREYIGGEAYIFSVLLVLTQLKG